MIIGVSGYKRAGKDEFCKAVKHLDPSYVVRPFAAPLKRIAREIFHLTDIELHNQDAKEKPFADGEIEMDLYLEYLEAEVGFGIEPRGLVAKTPRELLQFLGTDYIRAHRPRFWLDAFVKSLGHGERRLTNVLVPDTRFLNEVGLIRMLGGKIVRVIRTDQEPSGDMHPSERDVDKIVPDFTVYAATGDLKALERAAAEIVLSSLLVEGGNAH